MVSLKAEVLVGAGTLSHAALKTQFGEMAHMSQDVIGHNLTSKATKRMAFASRSLKAGEHSWITAEFKLSTTLLS